MSMMNDVNALNSLIISSSDYLNNKEKVEKEDDLSEDFQGQKCMS